MGGRISPDEMEIMAFWMTLKVSIAAGTV